MNYLTRSLLILTLSLFSGSILAQQGTIRGTAIEDATGEPLFGVTIVIAGTTNGQISDFDGKFELKADPGVYSIQASFVSFKTVTITDIEVKDGEVTVIDQVRMVEDIAELEEIVVTAEAIRDTEVALVTMKRKSATVMDGISAMTFRKIGDSDAGQAVKRVTGVSVEGGKYVYVRGLGDRYTKTTMNGVDIPGLDPDRNTIQIDIFPTTLIDNMIILKSFTPELPADFTGGIVNIETKDFPDEKIFNVSASVGYNPAMHFNDDFLKYNGGGTDWLGFDDGARELPARARVDPIPSPFSGDSDGEVFNFLNSFGNSLGAFQESAFMNFNFGLTYADQKALSNGYKLGYIVTGTYRSDNEFYDDVVYGEFQRPIPSDEFEMVEATTQGLPVRDQAVQDRYPREINGAVTEQNVLLGGLAGIALKTKTSKYKFNFMHLQNGESRAAQFQLYDNGEAPGKSGFEGFSNNLEYNQRGLTHLLLNGIHHNEDATWKVDWRAATTISSLEDPDIRKTAFTISYTTDPPDSTFLAGAAGNPSRIWRELDEINIVGKVDVTREHNLFNRPAKLRFGASHVFKERDYLILAYDVQFFGTIPEFGGNPDNVFADENLFGGSVDGNVYLNSGNNVPNPNEYNSTVSNTAAYISTEFTAFPNFKSILGVRAENFVQRHTGRDAQYAFTANDPVPQGNNLDDEKVLDALDLFPSVNFIYTVKENTNFRLAYSRTIARPSFKELSFAQILDPVSNRIFNGGLFEYPGEWDGNLVETRINNFDFRWEYFMERGQLLSFSAFYKTFDKPIELVRIPQAQTNNEFQPRNVGESNIFGIEMEFIKSLEFLSPSLKYFNINGNLTVVQSSLKMNETEFRSRQNFQKDGETIEDTRDMAGQAPYIINAGFNYNNYEIGLDAGLFYNVKGRTLSVVGGGIFPDVYSEPFHSLNFNIIKTIGERERASITFSVDNILNDKREELYEAFRAQDQIFYSYSPGTEIGLGFSFKF